MYSKIYSGLLFLLFCHFSALYASNNPSGISALFTIDVRPPEVTILSPSAGQQFINTSPIQVTWNAHDDNMGNNPIDISLLISPAGQSHMLTENADNTGSKQVNLPGITTAQAIIRVSATDLYGNTGYAQTSGFISIIDDATDLTYPTLADQSILKIYPNPANHEVWVEYNKTASNAHTISLVNTNGQVLSSERIYHTGNVRTAFSVDGLPAGLYLIRLDHGMGIAVNKFLVR